jgi:hypothetical protein
MRKGTVKRQSGVAGRVLMACLLSSVASLSSGEVLDEWHASKIEAAQLPPFCWGQMMDSNLAESRYWITDCGSGANHYCLGLLKIVRANKIFGEKWRRSAMLRAAKDNTLYTLEAIKNYPNCSIRSHAEQTLQLIESQLKLFK